LRLSYYSRMCLHCPSRAGLLQGRRAFLLAAAAAAATPPGLPAAFAGSGKKRARIGYRLQPLHS